MRWHLGVFALAYAVSACGGSTLEAGPAEAPSPGEPEAPAPKPVPKEEPEPRADTEAAQLAEAERRRQESIPLAREVLYKVTPEGLVVDIDGVRLRPKAKPTKKPNGGYGIEITVEAESIDDDTHVLLSPESGPLSFAVTIYGKNGAEQARHSDTRTGDDQQFIMPGGPLTLTREWPSGSAKGPLWWGQRVVMHVGLWGLGRANEKTRPMKKFFVVEMVGGAKAQAVISPPEIDRK